MLYIFIHFITNCIILFSASLGDYGQEIVIYKSKEVPFHIKITIVPHYENSYFTKFLKHKGKTNFNVNDVIEIDAKYLAGIQEQ